MSRLSRLIGVVLPSSVFERRFWGLVTCGVGLLSPLASGLASELKDEASVPAMPSTAVLEASGKVPGVEGRPLRLEEALRLARVRNQDVKSARLSVDAALAELRSARQWQNPSLGLSVARINTGSQGSGTALGNRLDQRSYDSITSLSQLIELGGKRSLRIESAEAGRRQAEAQAEDSQRLLEQSVALAYVSGAEAQEEARILAESAASLTKEAALAAERLRVGDIRSSDEEQIRLAAERLEVQADTARSRALGLVVALELLTGEAQPRGTSLLVDGPGAGSVEPVSETGEAILSERPDVQALLEGMRKSELDLTRSKRDAVPDLTASLQFEHNPPGPDSLGFSVSFPLPVWNRNRGAIQTARV